MKFVYASIFTVTVAAFPTHPGRAAQIDEIRKTKHVHWRADAVHRFQHEAPGAAKGLCGVKGDWAEEVEKAVKAGQIKRGAHGDDPLPDVFDSATRWPACAKLIGDIRDQSNCGCCWAFAGAEAASDRMCIATNASIIFPLSAEDICFCGSDNGCNGGFIQQPWMYIMDDGAVTGGQYNGTGPFGQGMCKSFSLPHCHHHGPQGNDPYPAEGAPGCPSATSPQCPTTCDASASHEHSQWVDDKYTFLGDIESAKGEESIQRAIFEGGPVETAFTVYQDFENYAGGVYHHVTGPSVGGHAVKMVGWGIENGTKYWRIANSWNPHWGENGYFRILRGSNEAGVEASVIFTSPAAKWHKKDPNGPCVDTSKHCSTYRSECHHADIARLCRSSCGCCVKEPPAFCPKVPNSTAIIV